MSKAGATTDDCGQRRCPRENPRDGQRALYEQEYVPSVLTSLSRGPESRRQASTATSAPRMRSSRRFSSGRISTSGIRGTKSRRRIKTIRVPSSTRSCAGSENAANQPTYRGCPQINVAAEFPEAAHPARKVAKAHKRELRARLKALAERLGKPRARCACRPACRPDQRRLRQHLDLREGRSGFAAAKRGSFVVAFALIPEMPMPDDASSDHFRACRARTP